MSHQCLLGLGHLLLGDQVSRNAPLIGSDPSLWKAKEGDKEGKDADVGRPVLCMMFPVCSQARVGLARPNVYTEA